MLDICERHQKLWSFQIDLLLTYTANVARNVFLFEVVGVDGGLASRMQNTVVAQVWDSVQVLGHLLWLRR